MTKFLEKYYDIMSKYRNGEFGEQHLTLNDILLKANEGSLINDMTLSEIEYLIRNSSGMTKQMFTLIKAQKSKQVARMKELECELESYNIPQLCGNHFSGDVLASKLGLNISYYNSLPVDVEAELLPPNDDKYFGTIKISKNCPNKFSYMHEIIHYLKDVGVGHRVEHSFARKKRGKTDSLEEQEVNYLTAAAVMPIAKILVDLKEYESINSDEENNFLSSMAEKYGQDINAVSRRFAEVRNLADNGY